MKANEIKAIETKYNGHRFRSRLEARWAVFFDKLSIKYEVNPESITLSDGTCYVPSFYLPEFNCYFEVKPSSFEDTPEGNEAIRKIRDGAYTSSWSGLLAFGDPLEDNVCIYCQEVDDSGGGTYEQPVTFGIHPELNKPYLLAYQDYRDREFFTNWSDMKKIPMTTQEGHTYTYDDFVSVRVLDARKSAKHAKFGHKAAVSEIKAIETEYNGYRFRSRLEARWALFFDALGIRYEYEPEGYSLSDGSMYLPDFYLPDIKYYVEVKGMSNHLLDDISKLQRFVLDSKSAVVILSNVPYDPDAKGLFWFPIQYYCARSGGLVCGCRAFFYKSDKPGLQDDFSVGCQSYVSLSEKLPDFLSSEEQAKIMFRKIQAISGAKLDDNVDNFPIKDLMEHELLPVEIALKTARQARFEHGETPVPTCR